MVGICYFCALPHFVPNVNLDAFLKGSFTFWSISHYYFSVSSAIPLAHTDFVSSEGYCRFLQFFWTPTGFIMAGVGICEFVPESRKMHLNS